MFASWNSYQDFCRRVRHGRRFVWEPEVDSFLTAVLETNSDREVEVPQDTVLYRAQRGVNWLPVYEGRKEIGEEPVGYDAERMKPLRDRAIQGRVNPAGIPVLYLASTEQTAISEVRPWIGAQVSVAQFIITRSLKMLDLSEGHGQFAMGHLTIKQILKEEDVDPATITKAVWTDIDGAFSRPVSASDDTADYVPTQILAELFRGAGYDGLIYRSMFGEKGYNLALFDVDDAELINCAPYDVRRIVIEAEESGNRWFATGNLSKRKPARRRRRPGKSL